MIFGPKKTTEKKNKILDGTFKGNETKIQFE